MQGDHVHTIKVKRKHRKLRKEFIFTCAVAFLLLFLLIFGLVRCACDRPDYEDFLHALAVAESSDRYDVKNRYGYLGRYQMGKLALQEAGFLDESETWTELAKSYGITSESDFLNSVEGQNAAVFLFHKRIWEYIRYYELDAYVGKTYQGVEVTESGLLAACHLVGASAMQTALEQDEPVCDANSMHAADYMERFSGFDISGVKSHERDSIFHVENNFPQNT